MPVVDPKKARELMIKSNLKPLEPYLKSSHKWKCKCMTCGEIVFPKYNMIKRGQGGCLKCGRLKVSKRMKLLHAQGKIIYGAKPRITEKQAIILAKANGRVPLEPFHQIKAPWKSKCKKCGTIGSPSLSILKQRGNSCMKCGRQSTLDSRKLSQAYVRKVFNRAGVELLVSYPHRNDKPLKCRCLRCKRIVTPTYANAKKHKEGCKYCGGTYVDPVDAKNFMLKMGYVPKEKYKGTDSPWKVLHIKCGAICHPTYGTIKRGGGGCRNCADWGFSYNKPSYLYLVTHEELGAHKVGIANVAKLRKSDRIHRHKLQGWQVYKVWNFEDGYKVMQIEAKIFEILRKQMKIPQFLTKGQMKQEGETETVGTDSITLLELEKIIKKVIRNNS